MIYKGIYQIEITNFDNNRIIVDVLKVNRCSIWIIWDGEPPIKYPLSSDGIIWDKQYGNRYDTKKWNRIS
jgi:hypothetical protein